MKESRLEPVVAGLFYPASAKELDVFFRDWESRPAPKASAGKVAALLLPHAGYVYSGELAALGYRYLASKAAKPLTLLIAGPSHYVPFQGAAVFAGEKVQTPIGDISVDVDLAERLLKENAARLFPPAFAREHSVEVHFPLVRHYLPEAKIVPVVLGQGKASWRLLAGFLGSLDLENVVVVASTDLAHYPPASVAEACDRRLIEAFLAGENIRVEETVRRLMAEGHPEYHCSHCGPESAALALDYARAQGATERKLLAYRHSGMVTGETDRVVGYGALVFQRKKT